MRDPNCIFCKIVNNEIPSQKYFEDENFLAIFDIKPITPGHLVLLSKNHYVNINEMPENEWRQFVSLARQLAEKYIRENNLDGYNLLINQGEAAQSGVAHRPHCHIIPRTINDGLKIDPRG